MSNKRARFDHTEEMVCPVNNVTITKNNDLPCDTSQLTVLTIIDNTKIKRITNLKLLTILRCHNTNLTFIDNIPTLYYLKLKEDKTLTDLSLTDMYKVKLNDCVIEKLCISRTNKVELNSLHSLVFVKLIDVFNLVICNMNITFMEQLRFFAPSVKNILN